VGFEILAEVVFDGYLLHFLLLVFSGGPVLAFEVLAVQIQLYLVVLC